MEILTQETVVCESCGVAALRSEVISKGQRPNGEGRFRHAKGKGCKVGTAEYQAETPRDQSLALVPMNVHLLIDVESQRGNLTNMWRAAGSPEHNRPSDWQDTKEAQRFLVALGLELNTAIDGIISSLLGREGASWAHWQACVEYARYLSPAFAIRWNEYARLYLEGKTREPQPITAPSPLSGIAQARSMAAHVAQKANEFLQALDMAGRRGVEFGDAMQHASPEVASVVSAMPELTHPKKAGFVYLTREPNDRRNLYKIGKSIDADKREAQIPGQMPTIVRNIKVIRTDNCSDLEDVLQAHFKAQRYGKEWYRLSDQQVAAMCDLPDYFPSTRFREISMLLATEQIVQVTLF